MTPARIAVALAYLLVQLVAVTPIFAQAAPSKRAVPADPIATVVDAFDSHRFVAILVNGFEEEHRFRLSLLNDPRFVSKVDDIVVEFGDARYQDVMDRFIAGDEVPYNELKRSWQQTTQPHHVSDAPIYEEFFRAVRAANDKLPEPEKIRVLLADPPSIGRRSTTSPICYLCSSNVCHSKLVLLSARFYRKTGGRCCYLPLVMC